jgi:capsule polysaccharide export protein KpsE/RkpR
VQEVKLGSMRNYLTENSPEFKQAMNELNSLKMQLVKAEKDEPLHSDSSDYIAKYREFKYQETLFELFARQFELAKLDESREGAVIQVLDVAEPPERKAKPKKAQIAVIATLAAGIALILFVFIRKSIQSATKHKENQERINELRASWKKALGF